MEQRASVVLYPLPGMGHLIPMVELAKLLCRRQNIGATVIVVDPPFAAGSTTAFISSVSVANPSISFHRLPPVDLSRLPTQRRPASLFFEVIRLSNPSLVAYLCSLPAPLPAAVIVDFFCGNTLDVGKLGIPLYNFFTTMGTGLALFLQLPVLHSTISQSFRDLGETVIDVPGVPPLPAHHMPQALLDRDDDAYKGVIQLSTCMPDSAGVIVNTFESLEKEPVQFIRNNFPALPVYCVGPLVGGKDGVGGKHDHDHHCLAWLDSQPKRSVVFLSFGSLGRFSTGQLREIANGLERSNQRFLWVVRDPPPADVVETSSKKRSPEQDGPDLDSLLPEGFLARTGDRGLVVKSWAPQAEVLRHEAVGGFVTHLGWNSVLEGVCAGVRMVGWPLYAEQPMNKVVLADNMRLVLAIEGYDSEVVTSEEVERKVRELMESEEGEAVGKRCVDAKRAAEEALAEGGTSAIAIDDLVGRFLAK